MPTCISPGLSHEFWVVPLIFTKLSITWFRDMSEWNHVIPWHFRDWFYYINNLENFSLDVALLATHWYLPTTHCIEEASKGYIWHWLVFFCDSKTRMSQNETLFSNWTLHGITKENHVISWSQKWPISRDFSWSQFHVKRH